MFSNLWFKVNCPNTWRYLNWYINGYLNRYINGLEYICQFSSCQCIGAVCIIDVNLCILCCQYFWCLFIISFAFLRILNFLYILSVCFVFFYSIYIFYITKETYPPPLPNVSWYNHFGKLFGRIYWRGTFRYPMT